MRSFRRLRQRAKAEELAVIRALLGEGERSDRLFLQVAHSKHLERTRNGQRYRLTSRETTDDLLIDLDDDVTTRWQRVSATTGMPLEFRLHLRRGGFFEALEGRCPADEWPEHWRVTEADLGGVAPLSLPQTQPCDAVIAWLRRRSGGTTAAALRCRPPAKLDELRQLESREGARLPPDYAELLGRSDGLSVGDINVHGSRDLYVTELNTEPWWVIASRRGDTFVVKHCEEPGGAYLQVEVDQLDPRTGVALGVGADEMIRALVPLRTSTTGSCRT